MDPQQIARWPGESPVNDGPVYPAAYHMLDVPAVANVLLHGHRQRDLFGPGMPWARPAICFAAPGKLAASKSGVTGK